MPIPHTIRQTLALGLIATAALSPRAVAQSTSPAVFVANNGNIEGSVTSFLVNGDGSLSFVQKVVTPGSTNAQCIDLSPNGRWLCTGHGTISGTVEQLTFFEVGDDATMNIVLETTTPDSPVDVAWLTDEYIVVTNTSASPNDILMVYRWDPDVPSITQVWFSTLSTSTFDIAVDRAHGLLYPRASTSLVWPMRFNADGSLTKLTPAPISTGVYYLGPGLSPDGTKLYYGGGISSGGQPNSSRWIGGFNIDTATGTLTPMPNAPYLSPPTGGSASPSPKEVSVSEDGQFLYVNHGGTGDIQGFAIDKKTGDITPINGSFFDAGGQGDTGNTACMGDALYVLRRYSGTGGNPPAGIIALTINSDGTLTPLGEAIPTQGSLPWDLVTWDGVNLCIADLDGSGTVDVTDLLAVITAWGACADPNNCPADVDGSGTVDVTDLLAIITSWGPCSAP